MGPVWQIVKAPSGIQIEKIAAGGAGSAHFDENRHANRNDNHHEEPAPDDFQPVALRAARTLLGDPLLP